MFNKLFLTALLSAGVVVPSFSRKEAFQPKEIGSVIGFDFVSKANNIDRVIIDLNVSNVSASASVFKTSGVLFFVFQEGAAFNGFTTDISRRASVFLFDNIGLNFDILGCELTQYSFNSNDTVVYNVISAAIGVEGFITELDDVETVQIAVPILSYSGSGYSNNYTAFDLEAFIYSQQTSFNNVVRFAYDDGFDAGETKGFDAGVLSMTDGDMFGWVTALFGSLSKIFNVEIFKGFTIGSIALIMLVFALVPFILGLFTKGGK